MKIFENFFGPKHIYFCSDFLTKTSPSAVSHLYHAPYKRLIYSMVSKTLQFYSRGQTAGDRLATCLYEAAALHLPGRQAIIDLHVRGIINYVHFLSR